MLIFVSRAWLSKAERFHNQDFAGKKRFNFRKITDQCDATICNFVASFNEAIKSL